MVNISYVFLYDLLLLYRFVVFMYGQQGQANKRERERAREKRKQSPQTMGTFWEFTRWILVYLLNWIELTMQRVYKNAKVRNRDEVRQWQRIDRKCEKNWSSKRKSCEKQVTQTMSIFRFFRLKSVEYNSQMQLISSHRKRKLEFMCWNSSALHAVLNPIIAREIGENCEI